MSEGWTFFFLLVAFVALVLAAVNRLVPTVKKHVNLTALGLASWVFISLWVAFQATR